MADFQAEKRIILDHHRALDSGDSAKILSAMAQNLSPTYTWRGFHPFGHQTDGQKVAQEFWIPLHNALSHLQRRVDVFFAGQNEIDGFKGTWVVSMGHLMGLFDRPWLGIRPTRKMAFLRYCEFNRVEDGKIVETAMYFDVPHLMRQAGLDPFGQQTAVHVIQPGPMTHDGILLDDAPEKDGIDTLAAINKMISDLGTWQNELSLEDELRQSWHEDMIWWGPEGIGATYTIPRYAEQHSGPFRAGFTDRTGTGHIARLAEGHYGGFFGWPNFKAKPVGGFMGLPAQDKQVEFRVIDIYRRQGEKLTENWIFIDMLYFMDQMGVDVLKRSETINPL